jgi:hypothetical protein
LEIQHAEARYVERRYEFEMTAVLDAPVMRVETVLRDYARYPMLDTRILEAKIIERPGSGIVLLETRVRACFGPFCRNVKRVERVEEGVLELHATTLPELSDVAFGDTRMRLVDIEGRTQVIYQTSLTPAFWIPSIVGRRLMLKTLREATLDLFRHVELEARAEGAVSEGAAAAASAR